MAADLRLANEVRRPAVRQLSDTATAGTGHRPLKGSLFAAQLRTAGSGVSPSPFSPSFDPSICIEHLLEHT